MAAVQFRLQVAILHLVRLYMKVIHLSLVRLNQVVQLRLKRADLRLQPTRLHEQTPARLHLKTTRLRL